MVLGLDCQWHKPKTPSSGPCARVSAGFMFRARKKLVVGDNRVRDHTCLTRYSAVRHRSHKRGRAVWHVVGWDALAGVDICGRRCARTVGAVRAAEKARSTRIVRTANERGGTMATQTQQTWRKLTPKEVILTNCGSPGTHALYRLFVCTPVILLASSSTWGDRVFNFSVNGISTSEVVVDALQTTDRERVLPRFKL
jgi:hypothetical protein